MLLLHKGNVIDKTHRESVRTIQVRVSSFTRVNTERILRIRRADIGESKNLARVIDRMAECVCRIQRQRILHEPSCVARLHRVVD